MFADGIISFLQKNVIESNSVDLVGTHAPNMGRPHFFSTTKMDCQPLGFNAIIQSRTGITTIFGFALLERGVVQPQISPVAYIDSFFVRHDSKLRVCLNIDELANINFVSADQSKLNSSTSTMSRSCGPGTLFIDYAMRYCTSNDTTSDSEGRYAAHGKINHSIVDRFLASYDYLRSSPTLNIAREMFGDHEAQRLIDECLYANMCEADTVATITRVTAQNILVQYRRLLEMFFPGGAQVDELIICGPGAKNANIVDYLEAELPESVITRPLEDVGIPGDANEAVCYAHLALEAVLGQATQSLGEGRQVPDEAIRARIMCGERWDDLLRRVRTFSGDKPLRITKSVKVAGSITSAVRRLDLQS